MFTRFDENPAMTLQDIKETKRYGQTHGRTHGRTDNVKTVYPPQTKFAGGITRSFLHEQVSVSLDKWEALCILMQYEIELKYTFGIVAF